MGKVSLFPVSLPTENSCYSPYQATGTSLSGIKTLIYIFWISRVGFSIPYETRTAQTRRVIIHGVATAGGSFSAAEESTDYIPDLISPISTRAEMPPNRSYYHRKIRISIIGSWNHITYPSLSQEKYHLIYGKSVNLPKKVRGLTLLIINKSNLGNIHKVKRTWIT